MEQTELQPTYLLEIAEVCFEKGVNYAQNNDFIHHMSTDVTDCQKKCQENSKCYFFVYDTNDLATNCFLHGIKAHHGNGICNECIRGPKYCKGKEYSRVPIGTKNYQ